MMNELINNPIFQSALLPFAVALITGALLRPLGGHWAGLGFAIAYAASVYVTTGFQFSPLTSTRKIILLGAGAMVLGVALDGYKGSRRLIPWGLAVSGAAAAAWVVWPVLTRTEGEALWIMLLSSAAYSAWLIAWFEGLRHQGVRAAPAALALGVGTGISALLGASALLGQLGGTIGAAAGGFVLLLLFTSRISPGSSFTLPVAVLAALIGIAAVVYAGLSWYALLPLAVIPLAARLPLKVDWGRFIKISVVSSYTIILAVVAIVITWQMTQTAETSLY